MIDPQNTTAVSTPKGLVRNRVLRGARPLGDDAFDTQPTGLFIEARAVTHDMVAEPQPAERSAPYPFWASAPSSRPPYPLPAGSGMPRHKLGSPGTPM